MGTMGTRITRAIPALGLVLAAFWVMALLPTSLAQIIAPVKLLAPATADASATGYSYFGNLGLIGGIPVYNGNYRAHLNGSGTYVNYVDGTYFSYGNLCNTSITAEFFDAYGRWYETRVSGIRWGCARTGVMWIPIYQYKRRGRMCSTLRQNGVRVTSVCHSIY